MLALAMIAAMAVGGAARAETAVERGAYLVNTIMTCNNCHTPRGPNGPDFTRALSGGQTFDEPPFTVAGANITPDRQTGIGDWSEAAIAHTLRSGVRPTGVPLAPVMPNSFYGIITDGDMTAIVTYLKSVKPIDHEVQKPVYRAAREFETYPGAEKPWTNTGDTPAARGFYLATIGHCMECHTPTSAGLHEFGSELGAGNQTFRGPWGVSVSSNITSDPDHGVGLWTDAELKRAITQGVSRDGRTLQPPMGYGFYAHMTDADLDAVITWLRTVPPKG